MLTTAAITRPHLVGAPVTVSLSGTTAASSALSEGLHRVISTVDCYLLQGAATPTALVTSSYLPAGVETFITVTGSNDNYLAGITGGGTGTLFITAQ